MGQLTDTAETGSAFYWRSVPYGKFFYYYDKDSGIRGVLCNKPECDHTDADQCGGGVSGASIPSLTLIGDRLYWIADRVKPDKTHVYTLYSMRTDATDRRLEHDIELPDKTNPQWFEIHRGFIYVYSSYQTVNDASPEYTTTLLRVPFEGGRYDVIATFDGAPFNSLFYFKTKIDGEYVYYLMCSAVGEYENGICAVFRFDSVSMDFRQLCSVTDLFINDLYIDKTGNVFVACMASDNRPANVYRLEDGEIIPYPDLFDEDFFCDSIRFSDGVIIGDRMGEGDILPDLCIKTFDGNIVYRGRLYSLYFDSFEFPLNSIYQNAIWGNKDTFFIDYRACYYDGAYYCWKTLLIRYDITEEGLKETLICEDVPFIFG